MAVCFAVSVWKQSGLCLYLWFLTCSPSVRIMSFNRVVCLVAWLPLHSIPLLLSSCFDLSHFFPHCPQTALLLGNSSLAGCLQLLLQSQDCSMYRSILFQGCGLLLFLPLRKLSLVSQHCVLYISTSNYSFPEHPTKKKYSLWGLTLSESLGFLLYGVADHAIGDLYRTGRHRCWPAKTDESRDAASLPALLRCFKTRCKSLVHSVVFTWVFLLKKMQVQCPNPASRCTLATMPRTSCCKKTCTWATCGLSCQGQLRLILHWDCRPLFWRSAVSFTPPIWDDRPQHMSCILELPVPVVRHLERLGSSLMIFEPPSSCKVAFAFSVVLLTGTGTNQKAPLQSAAKLIH